MIKGQVNISGNFLYLLLGLRKGVGKRQSCERFALVTFQLLAKLLLALINKAAGHSMHTARLAR